MITKTLQEYVKEYGQNLTASRLGLTQGAISQMVIKERQVYLDTNPAGSIHYAYEVKPVGKYR